MKHQRIPSLLLIITWIIHAVDGNITLPSTIDEKTVEPSSSSLSLNDSVCNLNLCQSSKDDAPPFCSCDKDCFRTGDCCLGLYSEEEETRIREEDVYETYHHKDFYDGKFIKVVGRCPGNATNETEVEQCHNSTTNTIDLMMLPMISANTNIIYKNLACGKCNEGSDAQFQLELKCLEGNKLPVTIEEGIHFYLTTRSCLPTIPSNAVQYIKNYNFSTSAETVINCPSAFTFDYLTKWRCSTYLAPFTIDCRHYKNIFCAQCNGVLLKQKDVECRKMWPAEEECNLGTGDEEWKWVRGGGIFGGMGFGGEGRRDRIRLPYSRHLGVVFTIGNKVNLRHLSL